MRKQSILSIVFLSVFFLLPSYAFSGSFNFSWSDIVNTEPNQPEVKTKNNGPPAHAPAHGYRAKHQYRYFPSSSVYHDADRGLYFYLSGSNWRIAASLPHDLQVQLGSSVSIEMDTDKPYLHHKYHKQKYPPGQLKKKKSKKWVKSK